MNRRRFLRQSALGIPAIAFFPSLLEACKKKDLLPDSTFNGKVAIIGAGASGLFAAFLLKQRGIDLTIYEASGIYGGRIRSLNNFSDFSIELGAEKIIGDHSLWYDMIRSTDANFVTKELKDFFFIENTLLSKSEIENYNDYLHLTNVLNDLGVYTGADTTADVYGNVIGISDRLAPLYNALVGNKHGTSNNRIGMAGLSEEAQLAIAGSNKYILKNRNLLSILEERCADVLDQIHLNTPIVSIDYTSNKIQMMDSNGNAYEADKVIVTVPIPVLFDNDISFNPNLPPLHLQGISNIGMDKGMKIILQFSTRFWNDSTGSIFGSGLVPEFWAPGAGDKSGENTILTAFINGENAEQLEALGDQIIPTILSELDLIFGSNVASSAYLNHYILNWGNEPFIRGVYSYPKPGTGVSRNLLAEPVAGKLFFAGEATHTGGHFGTVHGAMETGLRSVIQLLKS